MMEVPFDELTSHLALQPSFDLSTTAILMGWPGSKLAGPFYPVLFLDEY
jgi:hypothetical protein